MDKGLLTRAWSLLAGRDLHCLDVWKTEGKKHEIQGWNGGVHTSLQITTKDVQVHVGKGTYRTIIQDAAGDQLFGTTVRQEKNRHEPVGRWYSWTPGNEYSLVSVRNVGPPKASKNQCAGTRNEDEVF